MEIGTGALSEFVVRPKSTDIIGWTESADKKYVVTADGELFYINPDSRLTCLRPDVPESNFKDGQIEFRFISNPVIRDTFLYICAYQKNGSIILKNGNTKSRLYLGPEK